MTIKFIHLRNVDAAGNISNFGGMTIAYRQIDADKFLVGVAKCHERDNFNKAMGRAKARGRMNSPKLSHTFNAQSKQSLIQQVSDFNLF